VVGITASRSLKRTNEIPEYKFKLTVSDTKRNRRKFINHKQAHTEGTNINRSTMSSTTKEEQFPLYNKYIIKIFGDGQIGRNI
jgi:hypothetical protein